MSLAVTVLCGESVAQSLAEAARREAERRKALEEHGIEGKVIDAETLPRPPSADQPRSRPPEHAKPRASGEPVTGRRTHAGSYRSVLARIDNEIRRCEERLAVLRLRHEAEKFALPRVGRNAANRTVVGSRERIYWQIQETESKLKRLREERLGAYDAGKKAGFLPGELDGHGIVP